MKEQEKWETYEIFERMYPWTNWKTENSYFGEWHYEKKTVIIDKNGNILYTKTEKGNKCHCGCEQWDNWIKIKKGDEVIIDITDFAELNTPFFKPGRSKISREKSISVHKEFWKLVEGSEDEILKMNLGI